MVGDGFGFVLLNGFVASAQTGIIQGEDMPAYSAADYARDGVAGEVATAQAERSPLHETTS